MPTGSEAMVVAFLSGRPRAVVRRAEESTRLLADSGATAVENMDDTASAGLLGGLTDLAWNDTDHPTLALRVSLPPSNVGRLLESIKERERGALAGLANVADPGFGMVQLLQWPDSTAGAPEPEAITALIDRVRRSSQELEGAVVVEVCPQDVKSGIDVWAGNVKANELEIMRRIKRNLDPAGILNPGRFIGRL